MEEQGALAMDAFSRETAAVMRALRERDENTHAHCHRTGALCLEIGRTLSLSPRELETLGLAAELHDVGKIGIPDRILFKPGRLDEEELSTMRTHPRRGHDILASIPDPQFHDVAKVVLHHHEAIDGSGYPDGLKAENIPVLSRIVSIVDAYDAIATVRPYHQPRSHATIMGMLHDQEGRKYDAYVLKGFAGIIESSPYRATA